MNLFDPQDRVLLAGLALALIVIFARPIRYLLDLAREVERSSGLALVPALIILSVMFLFHQAAKRREAKARAEAAEEGAKLAESRLTEMERLEARHREATESAKLAESRLAEMERLVLFGQALGRVLDVDAIRDVVLQHLPQLAGTEDAWVMTRTGGRWQPLMSGTRERRREIDQIHERMADRALPSESEPWKTDPFSTDGHLCMPMTVGGHPVGVLGVPDSAASLNEGRRRVLAAAATLLGISLRNAQLFREVHDHSVRDGLTGCFNRTHALEAVGTELRRARRSQMPVSLIMFDLDHFKQVNDQYGHLCGDTVLAAVGARMREVLRISDLKCRYGGEEFLVLLPDTASEGARRVAHTLRRELADMAIPWKDEALTITASFGVATARPSEVDGKALISRADEALYRAKEQGRNCVRLSIETAVA